MSWTFAFWTPGHAPSNDRNTFGCSSHGFVAPGLWANPDETGLATWPVSLEGGVVAGSYAEVLAKLRRAAGQPQAAIILSAQGAGLEQFLEQWHACLPHVPIAGGTAAHAAGQPRGELLPPAEDVAVLLLTGGEWRAESLNAHDELGPEVECQADDPRTIKRLRCCGDKHWEPAATFFRACQSKWCRAEGDCESITFADTCGRNVHCSVAGDYLRTGADLPANGRLWLRTVGRKHAAARLKDFCSQPQALVFGCAGLRSLLDAPLAVANSALAGFMFGELVTLADRPQLGNLMASRLIRVGA